MQSAMDDEQGCSSSSSGSGTSEPQQDPDDRETPRQARAPNRHAFKLPAHTNGAPSVPKSLEEVGDQQKRQNMKKVLHLTRKNVSSFQCPKTINNSSSWSAAPHVRVSSTTKGKKEGERMKVD
jgi:hypothetical protein